jgi:hypothetical protein
MKRSATAARALGPAKLGLTFALTLAIAGCSYYVPPPSSPNEQPSTQTGDQSASTVTAVGSVSAGGDSVDNTPYTSGGAVPTNLGDTSAGADADSMQPGGLGWWKDQTKALQLPGATASLADTVYTIDAPRADLSVMTDTGMVPAAAGLTCHMHFIRCTCGKISGNGNLIVTEGEANDVIDALRKGGFTIVSMGSILLGEKPRVVEIRYQDDGAGVDDMASVLAAALAQTGIHNPPATMPM